MKLKNKISLLSFGLATMMLTLGNANAQTTQKKEFNPNTTLKSWSRIIDSPNRFKILPKFNNQAVLDRETGLVWQKIPDSRPLPYNLSVQDCYEIDTGGRKGWRLATIEEISSLIDPEQFDPALPENHPFFNVFRDNILFWSATNSAFDSRDAFTIKIDSGELNTADKKTFLTHWCVRTGTSHAGY